MSEKETFAEFMVNKIFVDLLFLTPLIYGFILLLAYSRIQNSNSMIIDIKGAAAKIYESLWMEKQLKHLEGHRDQVIKDLQSFGAEPRDFAILADRPNWIYAIRLGEIITVAPAMIVFGAYLLKGDKNA